MNSSIYWNCQTNHFDKNNKNNSIILPFPMNRPNQTNRIIKRIPAVMNVITNKYYRGTLKKIGFLIHEHFKNSEMRFDVTWETSVFLHMCNSALIEVNFQFPSGEGNGAKLLPAAASFRSLVHFYLRIRVYKFHSTFDGHHTHLLHSDAMNELKIKHMNLKGNICPECALTF